MSRILAIDPGGTTGYAVWSNGRHEAGMFPFEEAEDWFHDVLARQRWNAVVFEDFVITKATLQKSREGKQSIEFIGLGRYLCRRYNVHFETQLPSDAFSFGTNTKLKALGWWTPGPDHANAASRHLLTYMAKRRIDIDLAALARAVR